VIEIEGVSKRFGELVALSDVSLSIAPGERLAFVGPNGSGKTTLLRALLGLVRTTGRIIIDGVDVAKDPARALEKVAYIPQVSPPVEAPVRDVVRAIAELRAIDPRRIADRAEALGLSLERCAATRFAHLSGGMKQKLLAALALSAETPIVVCDEPTATLDAEARRVFFDEIKRGPPQRVVILCSHRSDELSSVADRIVEFREGRIERDDRRPIFKPVARSSRPWRTAC
jgi:ABC-2 type transport system ATP-binding protein